MLLTKKPLPAAFPEIRKVREEKKNPAENYNCRMSKGVVRESLEQSWDKQHYNARHVRPGGRKPNAARAFKLKASSTYMQSAYGQTDAASKVSDTNYLVRLPSYLTAQD